jgi:predicted nuclease of predicted toxin-antitoxin system
MRLLFDQNLSYRLVRKLSTIFPEAKQVRDLGLENKTDKEIWKFARDNDYSIVTFDADFYELSSYFGHPPKIIWLRTGNRRTDTLITILTDRSIIIKEFLANDTYKDIACIEIE